MTTKSFFGTALVLALSCFLQAGLAGGDKKKPQPAKDMIFTEELLNADLKDTVFTESFRKTYTVKLEKHKLYEIILNSKAFAPHLRLENAAREQIDVAANGRTGGASIYHRPAQTIDYEIIVTSQNAGAMGKFTLVVKEVPGDDGKPIELKNEKGKGVFEGKLLKTDPIYKGKKHKMLLFQMDAGKTYQIDMISKAFDSYLYLESPAGKYITEDDDGGGFPNARIIHKATDAGLYRIVCTYFSPATGDFKITIRQTD